jgi:hypothetical protein
MFLIDFFDKQIGITSYWHFKCHFQNDMTTAYNDLLTQIIC